MTSFLGSTLYPYLQLFIHRVTSSHGAGVGGGGVSCIRTSVLGLGVVGTEMDISPCNASLRTNIASHRYI